MKFYVFKNAEFNGNNYFASFLHVSILDLYQVGLHSSRLELLTLWRWKFEMTDVSASGIARPGT